MQKLILPINKAKLTASWKTSAYQSRFKLMHYGVDMISTAGSTLLYACGSGKVLATGRDNVLGNFLVIQYDDAYNRETQKSCDVVCRMWHMADVAVKKGDKVTKDTKVGHYGNTGQYTTGAHLHMEMDIDTKHPMWTPTLSGKTANFIGCNHGANDKTMSNPIVWLHCKASAPDNQAYTTAGDVYIRPEDKVIASYDAAADTPTKGVSITGIDVSKHNGVVDWKKVKASGKGFAMIRLGWAGYDGRIAANGGLDSMFKRNVEGAVAAGLPIGVYVYSYVKSSAAATVAARETLQLVKPYTLAYPIAFDIESTTAEKNGTAYDKMSRAANNAIVHAFLSEIAKAGHRGLLYTYKSFAELYLDVPSLPGYDVWIAQYSSKCTYKGAYTMWQCKGDVPGFVGECPGVTGPCDINISYKDYASIIK